MLHLPVANQSRARGVSLVAKSRNASVICENKKDFILTFMISFSSDVPQTRPGLTYSCKVDSPVGTTEGKRALIVRLAFWVEMGWGSSVGLPEQSARSNGHETGHLF